MFLGRLRRIVRAGGPGRYRSRGDHVRCASAVRAASIGAGYGRFAAGDGL